MSIFGKPPRSEPPTIWLLLLALLLGTHTAQARPEYHERLIQAAGTECPAQLCIACHQTESGGGAFSQPFYIALLLAGYDFNDPDTLLPAFQTLQDEETDSDEDGILDVDEIALATNPNAPGGPDFCGGPTHGCLRIGRRASADESQAPLNAVLLALLFGLGWVRFRHTNWRERSHKDFTQAPESRG